MNVCRPVPKPTDERMPKNTQYPDHISFFSMNRKYYAKNKSND